MPAGHDDARPARPEPQRGHGRRHSIPGARTTAGGDHLPMTRLPLVVLEGPPGVADREAARLRAQGIEVVLGFRTAVGRRPDVVRVGIVANDAEAADAVLAAIDGAGLVVEATGDRATIDRLVDDLRRLGPVDHRIGEIDVAPTLDADGRAILGLLAEGHSLGEAANLLRLSRRTADRRLAAARAALGVDRTTEAISRARRLGWFGAGNEPAYRRASDGDG
jgi:DNA-binding CsgD family transcriptional regulator